MRVIGLAATTLFLLANQACFIHVSESHWSDEDKDDQEWGDPFSEDDWNDDGDVVQDQEEVEDVLDVTIDLGTDQLASGEAAILDVSVEGEVTVDDIKDVWFDDEIDVLDVLVRDDSAFIAVLVGIDTEGWVEATFDFGEFGQATVEIEIVDPSAIETEVDGPDDSAGADDDAGDVGGDDGGDGEHPCP